MCVFVLAIKMFNLQRHSAQLPSWTRYPIVPMKRSPRVGTLSGTNLQVGFVFVVRTIIHKYIYISYICIYTYIILYIFYIV